MARKAKTETQTEGHGVSALRKNGYDAEKVQGFVDEIEEAQDSIDEIMDKAKDDCVGHREVIADIKKAAHDAGLPRRELNMAIAKRRAMRRIDAMRSKLAPEQQDNFDQIEKALGMYRELPLMGAALAAAARNGSSKGAAA